MSCIIEFRWGDELYARVRSWNDRPEGEHGLVATFRRFFEQEKLHEPLDHPGKLAVAFLRWGDRYRGDLELVGDYPGRIPDCYRYRIDCSILDDDGIPILFYEPIKRPVSISGLGPIYGLQFIDEKSSRELPEGSWILRSRRDIDQLRGYYEFFAEQERMNNAALAGVVGSERGQNPTIDELNEERIRLKKELAYGPTEERTVAVSILLDV